MIDEQLPALVRYFPTDKNLRIPCAWDEPLRSLPIDESGEHVVSMACLGGYGRWGNTLLQYVFLRLFAEARNAKIEASDWSGARYFAAPIAKISARPTVVITDGASLVHDDGRSLAVFFDLEAARAERLTNLGYEVYRLREPTVAPRELLPARVDLDGLFMIHTRYLVGGRRFLEPSSEATRDMAPLVEGLRLRGRTIVGLHLRRGDFISSTFRQGFELATPVGWCLRWLEENWAGLERPVLLLCSDDVAQVAPAFARYSPVTPDMLGAPPEWLIKAGGVRRDWHLLAHCDQLLISNSSFSFTAAMASNAKRCFRPDFEREGFVPFDPWDAEPLQFLPPRKRIASRLVQAIHFTRLSFGWAASLRTLPTLIAFWATLLRMRLRAAAKRGQLLRAVFSPATFLDADVPVRIRGVD